MKIRTRIQLLNDERGFALVLAISLITLVTMTAVSIMTLTQGEDTNSRRDQAKDGAYQAAEAGTNAYLSNLTENPSFFNGYMAKGEATRTDSGNVAHANDCVTGTTNPTNPPPTSTCSNLAWTLGRDVDVQDRSRERHGLVQHGQRLRLPHQGLPREHRAHRARAA